MYGIYKELILDIAKTYEKTKFYVIISRRNGIFSEYMCRMFWNFAIFVKMFPFFPKRWREVLFKPKFYNSMSFHYLSLTSQKHTHRNFGITTTKIIHFPLPWYSLMLSYSTFWNICNSQRRKIIYLFSPASLYSSRWRKSKMRLNVWEI